MNGADGQRRHLVTRLGLAMLAGAGVILVLAGLGTLHQQRQQLTHLVETEAIELADVVRRSTRQGMLRNDPGEVRRVIDAIASQPTIGPIRVFDKRGRIRTSTREAEEGTLVDTNAEQCYACHQRNRPLNRLEQEDRTRIFAAPSGERMLGVITPIRNEPACSNGGCHAHPPSQQVLGVLDVQISMAGVDRAMRNSELQMVGWLVGTGATILLLAGLLTWQIVLKPVRRLTEAASQVADGDLSARVEVTSDDEIGELSRTWNDMLANLQQAHRELEEWGRTLEQRVEEKTRDLEEAHRQMVQVEKMASLGKLAAVVAHEINNPLSGIATFAKLLQRKIGDLGAEDGECGSDGEAAKTRSECQRVLGLIEQEANRCGEIVRNLLLFGRTPAARISEEDIVPLVERCFLLIRHQADLQEVDLSLETTEDLPRIECDPSQIQQMVLALTMNALEAMPDGGVLRLEARCSDDGERLLLAVADTGRGIPPEQLDRIFEPFYTTKEEGDGVGLGLAVVYGIVRRHHGTIDVDSEPSRGTTFAIELPLRQPDDTDDAGESFQEVIS